MLVKISKAFSFLNIKILHIVLDTSLISISINSCPDIIATFIRYPKPKAPSIWDKSCLLELLHYRISVYHIFIRGKWTTACSAAAHKSLLCLGQNNADLAILFNRITFESIGFYNVCCFVPLASTHLLVWLPHIFSKISIFMVNFFFSIGLILELR